MSNKAQPNTGDDLSAPVRRYAANGGDLTIAAIQREFRVGYYRARALLDTLQLHLFEQSTQEKNHEKPS